MSFNKQKRDAIKHYLMEKISEHDPDLVLRTVTAFGTTKNTVYRYLRELASDQLIAKTKSGYRLMGIQEIYYIPLNNLTPEEDDVFFTQTILPQIRDLPQNLIHIWYYCFTEMMNNVIDHSQAKEATVVFARDAVNTTVLLQDNGIGIFHKIQDYYHLPTIEDAILELFKGKLTTDAENHSGEGIFFTSRIMDRFAAISDGKIFSHTEYDELIADMTEEGFDDTVHSQGTTILMKISNVSKKTTKEIMDQYSDEDGGFIRTRIPLKNIYPDYPVSRSQAKRLTNRFDSFSEIELDFEGIEDIGQGFAHELFVVYAGNHPEITLIPFHVGINVQRMINHVAGGNGKNRKEENESRDN